MKTKNKIDLGNVVWKDSKMLDTIWLIIALFFFIFSLVFVLRSQPRNGNELYKIFLLPIVIFTAFLLYTQVRKRRIFITSDGIRMGNLVHWADDKFIIKQKPTFFGWDKIENVRILLKSYRQGIYAGRDFYHVHLKNKDGEIYDCLVHDSKGFVRTLKKLNKIHLLDRKSSLFRAH